MGNAAAGGLQQETTENPAGATTGMGDPAQFLQKKQPAPPKLPMPPEEELEERFNLVLVSNFEYNCQVLNINLCSPWNHIERHVIFSSPSHCLLHVNEINSLKTMNQHSHMSFLNYLHPYSRFPAVTDLKMSDKDYFNLFWLGQLAFKGSWARDFQARQWDQKVTVSPFSPNLKNPFDNLFKFDWP